MWIADNEKYAVIALDVKVEGNGVFGQMSDDLWVIPDRAFDISDHWKEWLGSIQVEDLEGCNLFLLTKGPSKTPAVLDGENIALRKTIWNFYAGLLLASPFAPAHAPVLLTGSRQNDETDIRQQEVLDAPIPSSVRHYPAITSAEIRDAAHMAQQMRLLAATPDSKWRLNRVLSVYIEARPTRDVLDRLHQYCRCIEGLILPKTGDTKKQFKSRTELFIGPRHHDLMGEIYDVRSAVEHLHENKYLETFDRNLRLEILKMEAVIEHIARTCLARIISNSSLWPHFANAAVLATFWSLPVDERRTIWGDPINPLEAITDFKPEYINNSELGAT